MKNRIHIPLFTIIFLFYFGAKAQWQVSSPNGKIQATIQLNGSGEPIYSVDFIENGTANVISTSQLGLNRNDCDFRNGLTFNSLATTIINENYEMISGKKLVLQNQANEITLNFTKCSVQFTIIFRAYNDGIAFRYQFPQNSNSTYFVFEENSSVKVSTNGKGWMQRNNDFTPVYEDRMQEVNIGENAPSDAGWVLPALLNPANFWVLITETDLNKDYFASHLSPYPTDGNYRFEKPRYNDGTNNSENAYFQTPMKTPWRVVMIGKTPDVVVESNLVNHLSTSSVISDKSWIKSGVSTWSWWSGFQSPKDYTKMTPFIDLSSSLGFPYFLVDANWNQMVNGDVPQLVNYANTKNVKLWLWYNSAGTHNTVSEQPRDFMHIASVRQAEFLRIKNLGIVGVKIDFFQSDKQEMIKLYLDILQDAANAGLMVNFHGCTIPRGWQRTFPNLLTMEAVKGAESILFDNSYRNDSPQNNVNLAFTRNVVGSMDYTPGIVSYSYYEESLPHSSTVSHELALVSLFESGIVHLCDYYSKYDALPALVKSVLSKMPTAWDETKFIEGIPNDYVVLARRKGNHWYFSGINGKNQTRTITLNPTFVAAGQYTQQLISDGTNPIDLQTTESVYQTGNPITITMKPYGGFTTVLREKCLDIAYFTENLNNIITEPFIARQIISTSILVPPAKATYSANYSIRLNAGFQVQQGSVFKAEIGGCQ